MGTWPEYLSAVLGAAATLLGFVIVGISINASRIASEQGLARRALEALVAPGGLLLTCVDALQPFRRSWLQGVIIAVIGLAMFVIPTIIDVVALRARAGHSHRGRMVMNALSSWPFIISGILLVFHRDTAMSWFGIGVGATLIVTVINAWVVLIEILR